MHSLFIRSQHLLILTIFVLIVLVSGCGVKESIDQTNPSSDAHISDVNNLEETSSQPAPKPNEDDHKQSIRDTKRNAREEATKIQHIDIKTPGDALFIGVRHPVTIEITNQQGESSEASCSELTNIDLITPFPEFILLETGDDGSCHLYVDEQAPIGSTVQLTVEYAQKQAASSYIVLYDVEQTIAPVAGEAIPVVTNADSIAVFVNKERSLPSEYRPEDLVEPNVRFSFSEAHDKRLLRKEAAAALEKLFAAAEDEQIELVAVSGFRSYNTQRAIYEWNVNNRGEEHAKRFSAYPGTSEHQTGLAMDVSSPSVGNALDQALGNTKEGQWLADNAHRFGFIIRYPKDKEAITGYAYEPWHLRYVGEAIATEIHERGITLEEFFDEMMKTIPVMAP